MSDASRFRRDCENRTFSERQLDKFILKEERQAHKKEIREQEDKILKKMVLDKTSIFNKNIIDKQKLQSQNQNQTAEKITKDIEVKQPQIKEQNQQQSQSQQQQVQVQEAIIKVYKHLENDQKCVKAIQTMQKLIQKYINQLSLEHRLDILCVLYKNRRLYVRRAETRQILNQIYETIVINQDNNNNSMQEKYKEELKILNIFYLDYLQLETDDTFSFSALVKRINDKFDSILVDQQQLQLQKNQQQQQSEQQKEQEQEKQEEKKVVLSIRDKLNKKKQEEQQSQQELPVYEYKKTEFLENLIESGQFRLDTKIQTLFEIFKDVLQYYKHQWAKPTINQLISDVYHNKRFSLPQEIQDKMHEIADQWIELKNADTATTQKRNQLDGSIGVAGQSNNEVKDGRTTRLIFDNGANTWGNKQNGL